MNNVLRLSTFCVFLAAVLASPTPVRAESASASSPAVLFVFRGAEARATVLDPQSLATLAEPVVAPGAFRAFGLPDPANASLASKYYVVSPTTVQVIDDGFQPLTTIDLPGRAGSGELAAALSSDGLRLAVVAGRSLVVIDTERDVVVGVVDLGFTPIGVVLHPDGRRAVLPAAGVAAAGIVTLEPSLAWQGVALLPTAMNAAGISPNGARAMLYGSGNFYTLESLELAPLTGDPEALLRMASTGTSSLLSRSDFGAARPPARLEVTDSGRFYLNRRERFLVGRLGVEGPTSNLRGVLRPGSLGALTTSAGEPSSAPGWAVSADGGRLYVASPIDATVRSSDPEALEAPKHVALGGAVTGLDWVKPRRQAAGSLQLVSTDTIVVAGGRGFSASVRALNESGGPQNSIPIFVSNAFPAAPAIDCFPGVTDFQGEATFSCSVGESAGEVIVQLTISDAEGRSAAPLMVRVVPPTAFEGLAKIDGDLQRLPTDTSFALTVQASRNRLPDPGVPLTIAVSPGLTVPVISCPSRAVTGEDGTATFTCTVAEAIALTTAFEISVASDSDEVIFQITIDPFAARPNGLTKISGDGQVVRQGALFPLPLVISSFLDMEPRSEVVLNVTVTSAATLGGVAECPLNAVTDEDGIAEILCRALAVFFDTSIQVDVSDAGRVLPEPFTATITQAGGGVATALERVGDEPLEPIAGEPLQDGLIVKAVTGPGESGVQGVEVFFFSEDDVTFEPSMVITNARGIASTTMTLGCNFRNEADVFAGFSDGEPELEIELEGVPGPFTQLLKIQGDNQSGAPGQLLNQAALVARTSDVCGNEITGLPAVWEVRPNFAASLRNVVNVSDGIGRVSSLVTLGSYGGPLEVVVSSGEIEAVFSLAVNLPAEQLRQRAGDAQIAGPNQFAAQPLVVDVIGISGFGVGNIPVAFSVVEGQAALTVESTSTNGSGVALTRVRSTDGAPATIQARAIDQTVMFTLNSTTGPLVTLAGIVNGASFQTGITPGALVSIFGTQLTDVEGIVSADAVPFPTTLAGVSVTINGVPAPMITVVNVNGQQQLNLQAPFETAPGEATVVITNNGRQTTIAGVQVSAAQPGVFEITVEGVRIAAALHQDFTLITPSSPAIPGEVVQLFFTGAGLLDPPVATNQPGPIPAALTDLEVGVTLDGAVQQNLGAFYAPGLVTANQTNFVLDAAAASGARVLVVSVGGILSPETSLPVQ